MNTRKKTISKELSAKRKRLKIATKSLEKMLEEIEPFLKIRKFEDCSTAGEWNDTNSMTISRNF